MVVVEQHNEALRMYAHQLSDDAAAAEYCDRVYNSYDSVLLIPCLRTAHAHAGTSAQLACDSGEPAGKDVYILLLDAYINPPRRCTNHTVAAWF